MRDLECRWVHAAALLPKVIELPPTERFFLWAIRAWASAHTDITEVWSSLDRGFTREHIPNALEPFDRMMSAVFAGLARWPDIRCVRCPYVGAEEAHLLAALAALRRGNEITARAALHDWIRPAAARQVCKDGRVCMKIAAACGVPLDRAPRAVVPDSLSSDSSSQRVPFTRGSASQRLSPSSRPVQPS
jgi:hypothetical protein